MARVLELDPFLTPEASQVLLEGVRAKLGVVPNMFRVLGNSPAALKAYLDMSAALGGGSFSAKRREQIALTVAEANQCAYCLSAHSFVGARVGLTAPEIADARRAEATEVATDAVLKLARRLVVQRGEIDDAGLAQARVAGLTDGEILETVGNVALNIFTNYVNHLADTTVDFPAVRPGHAVHSPACDCG